MQRLQHSTVNLMERGGLAAAVRYHSRLLAAKLIIILGSRRLLLFVIANLFLLLAFALPTGALPRFKKKPDAAATSFDDYVSRMRATIPAQSSTLGSLWVSSGSLSNIFVDYKARNIGDLIVVHLLDNFTAATAGENNHPERIRRKT